MKKYTFLGCVSFLLGMACVSLAAIAVGTTRWKYNFNTLDEDGLFERCNPRTGRNSCSADTPAFSATYIRVTQVFMIVGSFLALVGLVVAMVIALGCGNKKTHIVAGVLFLIAGILMLVACSVYTGTNRPDLSATLSNFGYSLWLAWAAAILAFLIAPIAFLAKTNKYDYA